MDAKYLLSIHKHFGKELLKTYPIVNFYRYFFYYPFVKRMKVIKPLNYMNYNKSEAIKTLEKEMAWRYYGGKHYESRFTKFFQSYYLPTKFGYDKRRAHLSSLIVANEISRDDALKEIAIPSYDPSTIKNDIEFVAKKLGVTTQEFEDLIKLPNKTYKDYKSNNKLIKFSKRLLRSFKSILNPLLRLTK